MPVPKPGATEEEERTVCLRFISWIYDFWGFCACADVKEMSGKSPDSASTDLVANALAQMAFASWPKLASSTEVPFDIIWRLQSSTACETPAQRKIFL